MHKLAIDCIIRNHRNVSDFTDNQLERIEDCLSRMDAVGIANDENWREISSIGQELWAIFCE